VTVKVTEVAAAVIERPGEFLLAQRPEGKPYSGYWEFPGGKIEPGEDARAALVRELREELGIEVRAATPWITRVYAYTHATVRLHFFRVSEWVGEPQPLEDQAIAWQRVGAPDVSPMLPANAPVLAALALPAVMIVSDVARMGIEPWLHALDERATAERLLVQIREKASGMHALQNLLSRTLARVEPFGGRVVVNSDCGAFAQAHGVHLTARALMHAASRPHVPLAGASCHDARELEHAQALGLDYAVVGPVQKTATHPDAEPLGWERFASLAAGCAIPVYAIGGMTRRMLPEARAYGAHGVALLRAAFEE
jgi:8-oxo-dGTP diphosphatase